jgi:hypothetical protein
MNLPDSLLILRDADPSICDVDGNGGYLVRVDGVMVPASEEVAAMCIEQQIEAAGWLSNETDENGNDDGGWQATIWEASLDPAWREQEHGHTRAAALVLVYTETVQTVRSRG